jgi:hypothetical protein
MLPYPLPEKVSFRIDSFIEIEIELNFTFGHLVDGESHVNKEYTVIYTEYRSTLLPYPYKALCRNYAKLGLKSREECYESCVKYVNLSLSTRH